MGQPALHDRSAAIDSFHGKGSQRKQGGSLSFSVKKQFRFLSSSVGWRIVWLIACGIGQEESPGESHGSVTDHSFRVRERKQHSLNTLKYLDPKP